MFSLSVRISLVLASIGAIFALTGCSISSQSPLVTSLEGVQDANDLAEGAIPVLEATGELNPIDATIAMNVSAAVAQATSQAITEAKSTDSAAAKTTKIAAIYLPVLNSIPGLPPTVTPIIQGMLSAILSVEQQYSVASKLARAVPAVVAIDSGARRRLNSIQKSANGTIARVHQWKPSHSIK